MKWITCLILLAANGLVRQLYAQGLSRPNIILIVADDLGYGDLGCYGGRLAPTPYIDRLAAEGVRFTDGYASAATCAPSRLGLMSGRYQQRMGAYSNSTSPRAHIPENHPLMPQMLHSSGYHTAHIGKWHINRPVSGVFDEVYNEINGAADYFPGPEGKLTGKLYQPMQHGWSRENDTPYMTDTHGDAAVRFIKSRSGKQDPFFLYLAFNAPHSPWQAPLELKKQFGDIVPKVIGLYAAMVYSMDQNVGKVLRQLDESGIAKNTLVLFISDNGPEWGRNYPAFNWPPDWDSTIVGSTAPFSGRKAQFLEGGIRIPFIMRWPAVVKPGDTYKKPVSTLDLYETLRVQANGAITQTDGVNLVPFFAREIKGDPHRILFWQGGRAAPVYARMGDWKIMIPSDQSRTQLFNLARDTGENQNVADEHPDVTGTMSELVSRWKREVELFGSK